MPPTKPKKSSGPRDNDEDRLRKPPSPKFKSELQVKICRFLGEVSHTDEYGNTEVLVDPKYVHKRSGHTEWLCDPESELVFWCSQNSSHSVIVYDDKFYALMAVKSKRTKVKEGSRLMKVTAKSLRIQECDFEPETVEWIKDEISKFLMNRPAE